MNPNYSITRTANVQVLEVRNLLNEHANKEILQAVQSIIDEGCSDFVVDLKQIQFMNSVGLNFLITLRARSNDKGGQVAVANASKKSGATPGDDQAPAYFPGQQLGGGGRRISAESQLNALPSGKSGQPKHESSHIFHAGKIEHGVETRVPIQNSG